MEEYVNGRGNAGVSAREYGHKEETPSDKPMVLVVDDEPSIRQILKRWLTETGYEVETAIRWYGTTMLAPECEEVILQAAARVLAAVSGD